MLMKNFTLKESKSGRPGDPISYILSNHDHTGKERSVKPEIIGGDLYCIKTSIENNPRKFKYTSGVLAFGNNENPTPEQIDYVLEKFNSTFLPGNAQEHVPHLFVAHRDKGNLEIHYVIAREWTRENGTTAAFNIAPPGKSFIQFKDDFVATTNQELGFDQISSDPFSTALQQFDRLDKDESKFRNQFKGKMKSGLKELVMNGSINNRDDLIEFLQDNGTVTRINHDFISFKTDSQAKAIRLKGDLFKEDADYNQIRLQYKSYVKSKKIGIRLTPDEYEEKKNRLEIGVAERVEFNRTKYEAPKKSRTRGELYEADSDGKRKIKLNPNAYKPKRKRGEPTVKPSSTIKPKKQDVSKEQTEKSVETKPEQVKETDINKKLDEVTAKKVDTSGDNSSSNNSSAPSSKDSSIGDLNASLDKIRNQIQHTTNPKKLAALRAKASELEGKISAKLAQERIRKMKEAGMQSVHNKLKL
jgi:hypothetical protein